MSGAQSKGSSATVAAVILAGGRSTRMGGVEKSRLSLGGAPLIHGICDLLLELFPQVILVTNQPELHGDLPPAVTIVSDQYRGRGPLGGLQAGMQATEAEALFCVACDMPSLDRQLIRAQVAELPAATARGCQALVPRIGTLIEPLHGIYSRQLEPLAREICSGEGGYSIRILLDRARTCYWDLADSEENRAAFSNLNTPKDLRLHLEASGR